MTKEGFVTVTVRDETYGILKEYAEKLNRSLDQTIHSLLRGLEDADSVYRVSSLHFSPERICVDCGYRPLGQVDTCPTCHGQVILRYVLDS